MHHSTAALDRMLANSVVGPAQYADGPSRLHRAALLEQYKLYVEMADRVSARRGVANAFFLTINTGAVAAVNVALGLGVHHASAWAIGSVTGALLVQCLLWAATIHAYRRLSEAKWRVVGALERLLPARAWSNAECGLLLSSRGGRYLTLTRLEELVPVCFALLYGLTCIAALTL